MLNVFTSLSGFIVDVDLGESGNPCQTCHICLCFSACLHVISSRPKLTKCCVSVRACAHKHTHTELSNLKNERLCVQEKESEKRKGKREKVKQEKEKVGVSLLTQFHTPKER